MHRGHGTDDVMTVRDFNLMRSLGMNSFRMNSYPPPESVRITITTALPCQHVRLTQLG